jgi:hypothetical protein
VRIRWRRQHGRPFKPLIKIQLGHTRFNQLDSKDPDQFAGPHFKAFTGVRVPRYSEFLFFGNPGHYPTYVVTASTGAPGRADWPRLQQIVEQAGHYERPYPQRPT